ncbi:hypothetical protein CKAN_00993100 [Cinnamomum micranthum f. kanehirae]|uniref:Uncharacterized protein n=1 Tax=Cinnamomum micranthum f. kanehirae TaxID=337451 RepID=A0A3S3NK00_9MAGN|nr:hypothetical protein CKAN_00993100 [Cinnamomum micranthum f. kanehirae]
MTRRKRLLQKTKSVMTMSRYILIMQSIKEKVVPTIKIKEMTTMLVYVAEKLNQTGLSQTDVVAAVQELELEKSLREKALRMLRDPQASSQFLAFRTKED